jgi:hypothetical protein
LATADAIGPLLGACAVGVLAGLASAHVRLHLGLPGHKALILMAPVIFARLVFGSPVGATGGMVAASLASLTAGGNALSVSTHLPLAAAAGAVIDLALGIASRRRMGAAATVLVAGAAGVAANVLFFAERLLSPLFQSHTVFGLSGLDGRFASYAVFGLLAGAIGAAAALLFLRRRASDRRNDLTQ